MCRCPGVVVLCLCIDFSGNWYFELYITNHRTIYVCILIKKVKSNIVWGGYFAWLYYVLHRVLSVCCYMFWHGYIYYDYWWLHGSGKERDHKRESREDEELAGYLDQVCCSYGVV